MQENLKDEVKKGAIWGILGVLLAVFLFFGVNLMSQQETLNNVSTDSNDIEYLSSSTQRLVRLRISGLTDEKLLYYINEQTELLLSIANKDSISVLGYKEFNEMAKTILDNWQDLNQLLNQEEADNNALLLSADNHFYKMTDLADAINEYSNDISNDIVDSQYRITLIMIIFAIVILNNFMSYRGELSEKREQAKLAQIDSATGLYNRSKCHELFRNNNNAGQEKTPALIVFDLNDLKQTNDMQGHRMGDELIRSFANLLKSASDVHKIPPFIGRYGGDEFIVYYSDIETPNDLKYFLKELAMLSKDFNVDETRFQISYAHGYKISEGKGNEELTVRQLFDLADESMYENKKQMKLERKGENINIETTEIKREQFIEEEHEKTSPIKKEDRVQKTNKRTLVMVCVTLLVFIVGLSTSIVVKRANKEYIGGNVIYLPIGDGSTQKDKQSVGNPWYNASLASALTFRALFTPNNEFTDVYPDLATSYEIKDDGLTYVITLGDGIKWSDGTPLTMDDIVFSIESFLLCGTGNVNISTAFNRITGVEDFVQGKDQSLKGLEVNGNELTIRLDNKHTLFMQMLAQFVPLPKHILGELDVETLISDMDFYYNPVCSGMYMVEGMDEDYNLVLVKNPYYTAKESDIEKVVFLWDYVNATIDYYGTSDISQMVSYRAMRNVDEYNVDVHFYRYFVFNIDAGYQAKTVAQLEAEQLEAEQLGEIAEKTEQTGERGKNTPIDDARVRKAISHAINRPQLLSDLYFDVGKLTAGGPASESDEEVYGYNPELSRQLLLEAEYDFDRVFTIAYYHSDATTYIFLQQVKEYLEAVGLTVEIVKSTGSNFMYEQREFDMLLKGLSSFNIEDWYNEFLSTNGNMSALMGDEGIFDETVHALSSTTDEEEYAKILKELTKIEQEHLYKMPLFTLNESIYIFEERISVPDDMVFYNTRYRSNIRFDEWYVKKD